MKKCFCQPLPFSTVIWVTLGVFKQQTKLLFFLHIYTHSLHLRKNVILRPPMFWAPKTSQGRCAEQLLRQNKQFRVPTPTQRLCIAVGVVYSPNTQHRGWVSHSRRCTCSQHHPLWGFSYRRAQPPWLRGGSAPRFTQPHRTRHRENPGAEATPHLPPQERHRSTHAAHVRRAAAPRDQHRSPGPTTTGSRGLPPLPGPTTDPHRRSRGPAPPSPPPSTPRCCRPRGHVMPGRAGGARPRAPSRTFRAAPPRRHLYPPRWNVPSAPAGGGGAEGIWQKAGATEMPSLSLTLKYQGRTGGGLSGSFNPSASPEPAAHPFPHNGLFQPLAPAQRRATLAVRGGVGRALPEGIYLAVLQFNLIIKQTWQGAGSWVGAGGGSPQERAQNRGEGGALRGIPCSGR